MGNEERMKNEKQREIKKMIRPYLVRIRRQRQLNMAGKGMIMGAAVGVLVCVLAFFIPISWPFLWACAAMVAGSIIGCLLPLVLPKNTKQDMRRIDAYGFEERVQTMWELRERTDDFAILQREDATNHLQAKKAKKQIALKWERKHWIGAACGFGIMILLSVVPNPQKEALAKKNDAKNILQEQAVRVEEEMKWLAEDKKIDAEIKKQLNEELKKLADTLRKESELTEGMKEISNTQKKVAEWEKQQRKQDAERVQNELQRKEATRSLGEHLQDAQNQEALEQWEKELDEARKDAKKAQEIAKALKEAADTVADEALKEALQDAAAAIESGSMNELDQLSEDLQYALGNMEELDNDAGMSGSLGQISDMLKMMKSRVGKSSNSNQKGSNPASASGSGNGGSGSQGGKGSGKSSGNGGRNGNGGSGNGAGGGTGELKDYKQIYDATRLGGEGDIAQIEGKKAEEGESLQGEVEGVGRMDGYIPDQHALGDYREQAVQAAQREELPPAMQEWVSGYFESLQSE